MAITPTLSFTAHLPILSRAAENLVARNVVRAQFHHRERPRIQKSNSSCGRMCCLWIRTRMKWTIRSSSRTMSSSLSSSSSIPKPATGPATGFIPTSFLPRSASRLPSARRIRTPTRNPWSVTVALPAQTVRAEWQAPVGAFNPAGIGGPPQNNPQQNPQQNPPQNGPLNGNGGFTSPGAMQKLGQQ